MKRNLKIALVGVIPVIIAIAIAAFILNDTAQVVIDAGHGGNDVGAEYNGRYEKDDNLALALLVADKLSEKGIDVALTRDDDTFISLEKRCMFANRKKAQLFVSLHRNSAENAKGVEIWVSNDKPEKDTSLAENILNNLDEAGITQNRGVKFGYAQGDGNYYVNSHTNMPSCLVELGFINSEEDNFLYDQNLDSYAEAVAKAIIISLEEYQ
ncbi:MAG: N-acetylmuramoyl-L-alanine amidase [Acutalibacteraceae bacterium]|nr:N-acetylmuramoyl-L-alanine amidase [Acutalibacteraceae bacterium]